MTAQSQSLPSNQTKALETANEEKQVTRSWIIYGSSGGILGVFAYISAALPIPIPDSVKTYLGMAFGPLLSLAFVGFYHFLKLHRKTAALQAATIFGIIAGTLVNLMVVVQSAIHQTIPAGARESLGLAYTGLNMVQLGMDVSWDIYLAIATILLGFTMLRHPRFGIIWGILMLAVGAGLLVFNLATFPIPPANANSIDLGPVSGLLYLIAIIRVLTSLKWVEAKLGA